MEKLDQRISLKFSDMEMVREPRVVATAKQLSDVDSPHNSSDVFSNVSSVDFMTMFETGAISKTDDKKDIMR